MKDLKGVILVICYVTSMALALSTVYFLDKTAGSFGYWLSGAMVLAFTGIAISLVEVIRSVRLSTLEKVMWTIMIVFVYTIGELLYIIVRRRRVL